MLFMLQSFSLPSFRLCIFYRSLFLEGCACLICARVTVFLRLLEPVIRHLSIKEG